MRIRVLLGAAVFGLWSCAPSGERVDGLSLSQNVPDSYLGYPTPGDTAVLFAPGLVSVEGRFEFGLSVSPEGRELLFTGQLPGDPAGLLHAVFHDGRWSEPERVSLSGGEKAQEMEAFFTPDGRSVYFSAFDEGVSGARIWRVDRGPEGWASQHPVMSPIAEDPAFFPTMAGNGNLYYSSFTRGAIHRATISGGAVGRIEDTGLQGMHAFIAPDESFVLMDIRRGEGDADLFAAFRLQNGLWSEPVDLGPGVNTELHETCPSLSPDGRFIFFSRYNEPGGMPNIYWVRADLIDLARETLGG